MRRIRRTKPKIDKQDLVKPKKNEIKKITEMKVRDVPKFISDKKKKKMTRGLKEDYHIQPIKSDRDGVEQTLAQKEYTMPPPGLTIFCGSTGSGKTVAICNLLSKKNMLYDYFDKIIVFCLSPCPMLQDCLDIDEKDIINDDDDSKLMEILQTQKKLIKEDSFNLVPHILIILDDMAQSRTFLRSKALQELAFAATHAKISVWLTTQSYMQIPRNVRINAHGVLLFSGCKESEISRYEDEYGSQYLNKKQFTEMVKYAIAEPYSFLFANNTHPDRSLKFRKGFFELIKIKKGNEEPN